MTMMRNLLLASVVVLGACGGSGGGEEGELQLLNVSYDPTRELYREFNEQFVAKWLADTGQRVGVQMSHGGSGSQARAVIDGLERRRRDARAGVGHRQYPEGQSAPAGVMAIAVAE